MRNETLPVLSEEAGIFVSAFGKNWRFDEAYEPCLVLESGEKILFSSADEIRHTPLKTGLGSGESIRYAGFAMDDRLTFETRVLVNAVTGFVDCTFVPTDLRGLHVKEVCWPGPLVTEVLPHLRSAAKRAANERNASRLGGATEAVRISENVPARTHAAMESCSAVGDTLAVEGQAADGDTSHLDGVYAVLNTMQGQLLPANWPEAVCEKLPFGGQMCSEAAYMPWWGEIAPDGGYLCYVRQSWDGAYTIAHPAGGPTRIFVRHLPSLGEIRYARTVTYCFVPAGSSYVTLCRLYRSIAGEEGRVRTLREKAVQNPNVERLIGCCVMHVEGKTHVTRDSAYYNKEDFAANDRLVPFSHWTRRVRELKNMGVDRLYLHLDGWGQPGYDNQHPDYLPPCEELGGWEGMKELSDTMQELGFLFGVHDQYRDYYLDAPSYDPDNAVQRPDGSIFEMSHWAGGRQNYLCASLAPDYVRRNFEQLFAHGIHLEGTYLDVFTCNELDECANPHHPMTRRECMDARSQCFHYLSAQQIAPSSEEVNDWAVGSQVFCHWAPYMAGAAIPVPLFNLVYHDCVMIPWKMESGEWGIPEGTSGFLHALLNGGMGYLGEYLEGEALQKNIRQWQTLCELQKHVAMEEMINHEFLNEERTCQRTTFSDGTQVNVNFADDTWEIRYGAHQL